MKSNQEFRCYTFTLYQLSSIQQGIQSGHAMVELMLKYPRTNEELFELNTVQQWAHYWKTVVCLNGGDLSEIRDLIFFLSNKYNSFPWVPFYESIESLDGIPTSVAIVLPERIFKAAEKLRKDEHFLPFDHPLGFTEWEIELIDRLKSTGLAR